MHTVAMGWADRHIARLALGETVQFRPRGQSMVGKIASGQLCTVAPLGEHELAVGEIVLCRVGGAQYLHLVKAIQGERFQIGNNRGGINGWVTRRQIFGRLIAVDD
jgi:hypothetical protein